MNWRRLICWVTEHNWGDWGPSLAYRTLECRRCGWKP